MNWFWKFQLFGVAIAVLWLLYKYVTTSHPKELIKIIYFLSKIIIYPVGLLLFIWIFQNLGEIVELLPEITFMQVMNKLFVCIGAIAFIYISGHGVKKLKNIKERD